MFGAQGPFLGRHIVFLAMHPEADCSRRGGAHLVVPRRLVALQMPAGDRRAVAPALHAQGRSLAAARRTWLQLGSSQSAHVEDVPEMEHATLELLLRGRFWQTQTKHM